MSNNQPDLQHRWFISDYVLGAMDQPEDASNAVEGLKQSGFHAQNIAHLPGGDAAEQIDTSCEHCGAIRHIARVFWSYFTIQGNALRELEEQGRWGSHILAVHVQNREDAQLASQILESHNAHHVQYFGPYGEVIETAP